MNKKASEVTTVEMFKYKEGLYNAKEDARRAELKDLLAEAFESHINKPCSLVELTEVVSVLSLFYEEFISILN